MVPWTTEHISFICSDLTFKTTRRLEGEVSLSPLHKRKSCWIAWGYPQVPGPACLWILVCPGSSLSHPPLLMGHLSLQPPYTFLFFKLLIFFFFFERQVAQPVWFLFQDLLSRPYLTSLSNFAPLWCHYEPSCPLVDPWSPLALLQWVCLSSILQASSQVLGIFFIIVFLCWGTTGLLIPASLSLG